jgi:CheY-like chemotaxis protein
MAADDNDDSLSLLGYVLESLGCRFIGKTDSQEALLLVKEYLPDLILLDIVMPNLDGINFVNCLKQDRMTSNIPVIAVTALACPGDRDTILQAGFTDYISKPYLIDELENIIRRYLAPMLNLQAIENSFH